MFERPTTGERAVLVHLKINQEMDPFALQEFEELARAAGAEIVSIVTGSRRAPDPRSFIGSGKVEEILQIIQDEDVDIILFNHELSPVQERNLEAELKVLTIDRTGLILDIFARRARTHEGKLQVELAQLKHLSTRLVRGWTHLERQKGGIGMRGPGETQLESDRRLVADRIKLLNRRLEKVDKQRSQGRRSRERAAIPTVSLVGYTNAGKSTLFNVLTKAEVFVADQLFATLDPTLRRIDLPDKQSAILADTVGFIRSLPHDLVAAFRSTLQETREADLLLHVVDASDKRREDTIRQVNLILDEIGANECPQLLVYNKIDELEHSPIRIDYNDEDVPVRVWISAKSGEGIDLLKQAIGQILSKSSYITSVTLPPGEGRLNAKLHALGLIEEENFDEQGNCLLSIKLSENDWLYLDKHYSIAGFQSG